MSIAWYYVPRASAQPRPNTNSAGALGALQTLQFPMSFVSVEPQSRVVLESHSDSLLAQFDVHLGIIADRYLAFFQERSINLLRVLN